MEKDPFQSLFRFEILRRSAFQDDTMVGFGFCFESIKEGNP